MGSVPQIAPRFDGAFPVWRCGLNHTNDLLRGNCRYCGESRPCQRCGGKPARLYVNGMWCDACPVVAPGSFVRSAPEPRFVAPDTRTVVLEASRPAQSVDMPSRLRTLWQWCQDAEIVVRVNRVVVRIGEKECVSVALLATVDRAPYPYRIVYVSYVDALFQSALVSGRGTVNLGDAKRALGMVVAAPAPKTRSTAAPARRATKKDTMR